MIYDNVELLLMMDQHAVHERIRYENLLNGNIANYLLVQLYRINIRMYYLFICNYIYLYRLQNI